METKSDLQRLQKLGEKNRRFLHSPAHLLADELSQKLSDKRHFGFYLKQAMLIDHAVLRRLLQEVLESKSVKNPAKLFSFLVKKHNLDANHEIAHN